MTDDRQRILSHILLGALILWGTFVTLHYFAVPVHQGVMLDEAGQQLVNEACAGRGFICTGTTALVASIAPFVAYIAPFFLYIVLSLIVLAALAIRTYMRRDEFSVRVTLSPLIMIGLFVLASWGVLMSIAMSNTGGIPVNMMIEPTAQSYPDVDAEGFQDLRENFEDVQARGCLSPTNQEYAGAAVYRYGAGCMQVGFFTRVVPQILMLLLIAFAMMSLGRAALHALRLKNFPFLPEVVLSIGLGACLYVAILWLVAVLGIYTSVVGWILILGVPVVLFPQSLYWLRTFWSERWEIDRKPWSLAVILGWLLVSYLAFNFVNVVRPFPIGWDDLGRYMNQPRLLVSYGHFIPTLATFTWEYVTSLGFLLFGFESVFGATLSMLINWGAGLLAVLAVLLFGRTYLGHGRGVIAALTYYTLPMVGHFSFADMKVDNAVFTMGALAAYGVFLAVAPPGDVEEDEEHTRSILPLLALAGIFAAFSFAMKPTAVMLIMGLGAVMLGSRFGWLGFVGAFFLSWAVYAAQGILNVTVLTGRIFGDVTPVSQNVFLAGLALIGCALVAWSVRRKTAQVRPLLMQVGTFILAFGITLAPVLIMNNIGYGHVPPRVELTYPNRTAPAFILDGAEVPPSVITPRVLPPELQLDPANPACVSTSKVEELDRYWGNYQGIWHYAGLPWRAVMNADSAGYYVTLIPALLLLPLLLLMPGFWTRNGRWMRWMLAATLFIVMQWAVFANGIIWYGITMFLGLAVLLEALAVSSPTRSTRAITGVFIGISLMVAISHRMWQFDTMRNIFEYPIGKVTAEAMEERTIPHYDDIRDEIIRRGIATPERPYVYRMGTFIPYFLPKNTEVLPLADNQLDMFNCLYQERDAVKTLARLQALGFNSMIFDTNTQTIERDPNGSLHKKVDNFIEFVGTAGLGLELMINDPSAGVAYILLP